MAEIIDKRFPRIVTTDSQNNSDISGASGSIDITENGTIDVSEYAEANVQVPASAVVSGTKSITENGTDIDVTEYAKVDVNVPKPTPINKAELTLTISSISYGSGKIFALDKDGYAKVYNVTSSQTLKVYMPYLTTNGQPPMGGVTIVADSGTVLTVANLSSNLSVVQNSPAACFYSTHVIASGSANVTLNAN